MLELTGFDSVLRGIGFLYWALAIGALVLAIRYGKGVRGKVIATAITIAVFGYLPGKALVERHQHNAYAKEAWAYFKKLCDENSGEKIYKTYSGVKSVLVVKPLPPASDKDHFDQFWHGDPYSAPALSDRGELAAIRLTGVFQSTTGDQTGFEFIEVPGDEKGKYFYRLSRQNSMPYQIRRGAEHSTSRFGISWEDISTSEDRKFWVAASRLRIFDLKDNSAIAERIGYFIEAGFGSNTGGRRPWLTSRGPNTTCPPLRNGDYEDRWFVLKVLKPVKE